MWQCCQWNLKKKKLGGLVSYSDQAWYLCYLGKHPAHWRHWISRHVRTVWPIINCLSCVTFHVTCHVSPVTFHLSPKPTPTASTTDPPPVKSYTMHSRLVQWDRTQNQKEHIKTKKIIDVSKKRASWFCNSSNIDQKSPA